MPADRWLEARSCAGAEERAGAGAVDDAHIHDDRELLVGFYTYGQSLLVQSIG